MRRKHVDNKAGVHLAHLVTIVLNFRNPALGLLLNWTNELRNQTMIPTRSRHNSLLSYTGAIPLIQLLQNGYNNRRVSLSIG